MYHSAGGLNIHNPAQGEGRLTNKLQTDKTEFIVIKNITDDS